MSSANIPDEVSKERFQYVEWCECAECSKIRENLQEIIANKQKLY